MTLRKSFIIKKIELTKKYLAEAEVFFQHTDEEILHSPEKLHIAERLLQLIVDTVLDINKHIIKEQNLETPDDLQGTFETLSDNHIFEKEFAQQIGKVVGLRNRIVHQYETVDNKQFIKDFRKNRSDFDEYFKQLIAYLDKKNF